MPRPCCPCWSFSPSLSVPVPGWPCKESSLPSTNCPPPSPPCPPWCWPWCWAKRDSTKISRPSSRGSATATSWRCASSICWRAPLPAWPRPPAGWMPRSRSVCRWSRAGSCCRGSSSSLPLLPPPWAPPWARSARSPRWRSASPRPPASTPYWWRVPSSPAPCLATTSPSSPTPP